MSSTSLDVQRLSPRMFSLARGESQVLFDRGALRAWSGAPGEALANARETHQELAAPYSHSRPRLALYRIVVMEGCDWDCTYCFEKEIAPTPRAMKREVLRDVLARIIDQNTGESITIHWFGGEPLLAFSLIREGVLILESAVSEGRLKGVGFTMTTHGGRVTPEIASFVAEHKFAISVSLDGPRERNDLHRRDKAGVGTFDRAVRGYWRLRAAGAAAGVLFTATEELLPHLSDSIEFALHDLGAREVGLNTPQPRKGGWGVDGAELARQLFKATQLCEQYGATLTGPSQKILRALIHRQAAGSDCVSPDGGLAVSVSPTGTMGYCIVSWNDVLHSSPKITDQARERAITWKTKTHATDDCTACVAHTVCGGPCSLEAQLGSLDKQGRCAFHVTFLAETLLQAANNERSV